MALNLRLADHQDRQLTDLAASSGLSKQQVITQLIRKQWESEQARSLASHELDDIFTQRTPLMNRLKNA
ncbi:hypothetical protein [Corynebacterium lubricantis]|jgi:hypothetical protein|uniref:hypothetical protein n=1 Tax=Corynebacterium lubricantis TaxID=541095 RepID=UPI000363BE7D|nr:hypothetical protein [Corynebacterium lubricantis]